MKKSAHKFGSDLDNFHLNIRIAEYILNIQVAQCKNAQKFEMLTYLTIISFDKNGAYFYELRNNSLYVKLVLKF
jgi:hypothetical protein